MTAGALLGLLTALSPLAGAAGPSKRPGACVTLLGAWRPSAHFLPRLKAGAGLTWQQEADISALLGRIGDEARELDGQAKALRARMDQHKAAVLGRVSASLDAGQRQKYDLRKLADLNRASAPPGDCGPQDTPWRIHEGFLGRLKDGAGLDSHQEAAIRAAIEDSRSESERLARSSSALEDRTRAFGRQALEKVRAALTPDQRQKFDVAALSRLNTTTISR